jgi:ketosteroid isomerase-like protein
MAASEAHPNAQLIRRLYAGLEACNLDEIAACYADDAQFTDIAFELHGKTQVMQMWRMICTKVKPTVTWETLAPPSADAETGTGRWHAEYWYDRNLPTHPGRWVVNDLCSSFKFRNGLIVEHRDDCNVWNWAKQALAFPKNLAAAAIPALRRSIARKKLEAFLASERTPASGRAPPAA